VVLATLWGQTPLLLIDEPENYLHPPQIRRVAQFLAETARKKHRQVVVATHSSEFVQAAVQTSENVMVCRIERVGDVNKATVLSTDILRRMASDPVFGCVDAIEGFFHEGVVVCEGDRDCRFYEALLATAARRGQVGRPLDLFFAHGDGRSALPELVRPYRDLGVPVAVIADIDLLGSEGEFKKTVEALGGDFTRMRDSFRQVRQALERVAPLMSRSEFLEAMRRTLDEISSTDDPPSPLAEDEIREIRRCMKDVQKWSGAKKKGADVLEDPVKSECLDFLEKCRDCGLFLVPVGELESWETGPGNKRDWCAQALGRMCEEEDSFPDAVRFVLDVQDFLSRQRGS
jgi:hypothetical protein